MSLKMMHAVVATRRALNNNLNPFQNIILHGFSSYRFTKAGLGQVNIMAMVQSVTNIFEYLNIFDPNIRSYHFLDTKIFGYSFVSTFWIQIYLDIRSCQKNSYEYIRIFVCIICLTRIYSDTHLCQNPHVCHTLI